VTTREGLAVTAFESMSTWKQPPAPPPSPVRARLVADLADRICRQSARRLRVAVDGRTGAGKTTFADELAAAIRRSNRPTLRASLDDFKKPWRDAREKGYDRVTGEGYYRNAHDFDAARTLLLGPAGAGGNGRVTLCAFDPLTGEDHRATVVDAPADAVLVVDGVFAFRPEYDDLWDVRIWLDVPERVSRERGVTRDTELEGHDEAVRLYDTRYRIGEQVYIDEVQPLERADVVVDNTDIDAPRVRA
jgi:uridine kinase